jgi:hypothetical protein
MVHHNTLQTLGSLEQALRRSRGAIVGEALELDMDWSRQ